MVQIIQLWENWNSKFSVCVLGHWTISLRMAEIKATTQSNHKFLGSWFISKIHFVVRKKKSLWVKISTICLREKIYNFLLQSTDIGKDKKSFQKSGWKETILQFNSRQETIRKKKYQNRDLNNAGLSFIFTIQQTSIEHLGRHKTYNNYKTTFLPTGSHWGDGEGQLPKQETNNIC